MKYILKHFDTPLLIFSADNGANPNIKIEWLDEKKRNLLPLDLLKVDGDSLLVWIKHRSIPKNRAYVDNILSSMNLSINRPLDIIRVSKGLSLNDCYWIVEDGFDGLFKDCNLYDNPFSRVLGEIAFTGYGSSVGKLTSSPEYTTNGILPKCWRRIKGTVKLYKGATFGFSNAGNEPYAEYYASQIASYLNINAINYNIAKWKGRICSTCELFTSKKYAYIPIGRIVTGGGMDAVFKYYEGLGNNFVDALREMIVFDALIYNTDRHFGNFGILIDSKTNTICKPAPLFDHGNSLLSLIGIDRLEDDKLVLKYADGLLPCVYDDFVIEARRCMNNKLKKKVRSLLNFRFKKHPRYNLDNNRLKMMELVIHHRAKQLLDE